jgi:uncharacterized protein with HEPN domain
MQPENRDLAYLWDMREAARDVVEFVHGVSYANFCTDKRVRYLLEIINQLVPADENE